MVLMDRHRGEASGAFARELVQKQVAKLVQLQTPVASGEGSEPLHQMRVTCQQLRSTVEQFADALV